MSFRPAYYPCGNVSPHAEHQHIDGPDSYTYMCHGRVKPAVKCHRCGAELTEDNTYTRLDGTTYHLRDCPDFDPLRVSGHTLSEG